MITASDHSIELFLLVSISLFLLLAIGCLIVVFRRRYLKIEWEKKKAIFTPAIEKLVFEVVFSDKTVKEILTDVDNRTLMANPLHHKILLAQTVQLHQTFSGASLKKIEEFYIESGLIDLSFKKLESNQWNRKCEAIRELSEMRVQGAIGLITKAFLSKNQILQLESLVALIRLNGLDGLKVLEDYNQPINDWIQINVLYELKKTDQTHVPDFENLLSATNQSVVIFALRLISNYRQKQYLYNITGLIQKTQSIEIRQQAIQTLADFELQ